MKRIGFILLLGVFGAPVLSSVSQPAPVVRVDTTPQPAVSPQTAEVLKLANSGVGDDVVLAYVKNSQARFNLSATDIVALKNGGVSEPIITAMLKRDKDLPPTPAPVVVSPQVQSPPPISVPNPPTAATIPNAATVPDAPSISTAPLTPTAPPPVVVEQSPPAARAEVVPASPGAGYYWVPGYWTWNGTWVWVSGRYAIRPAHAAVWVPGHWGRHGRGYIWVGGYWR